MSSVSAFTVSSNPRVMTRSDTVERRAAQKHTITDYSFFLNTLNVNCHIEYIDLYEDVRQYGVEVWLNLYIHGNDLTTLLSLYVIDAKANDLHV